MNDNMMIALSDLPAFMRGRYRLDVSRTTAFRWVSKGCRGAKLKAVQVARTRHTTPAWIGAFVAEMSRNSGL